MNKTQTLPNELSKRDIEEALKERPQSPMDVFDVSRNNYPWLAFIQFGAWAGMAGCLFHAGGLGALGFCILCIGVSAYHLLSFIRRWDWAEIYYTRAQLVYMLSHSKS